MEKLKSMKLKESTHQKILLESSRQQLETGKRVTFDSIIQKALREGTINLDIPKDMVKRLKKEIRKRYGVKSLEEGVSKILEDWIKGRREK